MAITVTEGLAIRVLEPFASFADPKRSAPSGLPITQGSGMAKRQLTMGDCYRAADAIAAIRAELTRREREAKAQL